MHGYNGYPGWKKGRTDGERWNHWQIPEADGKREGPAWVNGRNPANRKKKSP